MEPLKKAKKAEFVALVCKCGACLHWEIYKEVENHSAHLICLTCREKYDITIHVPEHDNLHWIEREKV
jgi:hypothetical protein